jgi:CDP-diacylglycerol--glycerol-3-phosphate 3-phosphatidyltransferase
VSIYSIKPAFQRRLLFARDVFVRRGISADSLTALGLGLSTMGAIALVLSNQMPLLLFTIPVWAMGRIALNALDGMVAVADGSARPYGEVLNEVCDRLSDTAWFIALAILVDPVMALGALVLILISSYIGTVVKAAGGTRIYSGTMGKADRMILLSIASVAAYFWGLRALTLFVLLVLIATPLTALQRLFLGRKQLAP